MIQDALRSTEIQSGGLIIKVWATQRKVKNRQTLCQENKKTEGKKDKNKKRHKIRKDRKMKRQKSLKHSIAYQLFLDHGEPSSMPSSMSRWN